MLRGKNHICHAVERIGAGCETVSLSPVVAVKLTSAPVERPIQFFCCAFTRSGYSTRSRSLMRRSAYAVILSIHCDLILCTTGLPAAFTHAFHDFLIGKNTFAGGAPVDGHLFFIGETVLEELQENPLRPFVIIRVCGVDFTGPIKRNTQRADLLL